MKIYTLQGLSTETKPILADMATGSTYAELDTGITYVFNAAMISWLPKSNNNINTSAIAIGIRNIAKTSTVGKVDTYTIYYTSGAQTTFTVTNGKDISVANGDGIIVDSSQDVNSLKIDKSIVTTWDKLVANAPGEGLLQLSSIAINDVLYRVGTGVGLGLKKVELVEDDLLKFTLADDSVLECSIKTIVDALKANITSTNNKIRINEPSEDISEDDLLNAEFADYICIDNKQNYQVLNDLSGAPCVETFLQYLSNFGDGASTLRHGLSGDPSDRHIQAATVVNENGWSTWDKIYSNGWNTYTVGVNITGMLPENEQEKFEDNQAQYLLNLAQKIQRYNGISCVVERGWRHYTGEYYDPEYSENDDTETITWTEHCKLNFTLNSHQILLTEADPEAIITALAANNLSCTTTTYQLGLSDETCSQTVHLTGHFEAITATKANGSTKLNIVFKATGNTLTTADTFKTIVEPINQTCNENTASIQTLLATQETTDNHLQRVESNLTTEVANRKALSGHTIKISQEKDHVIDIDLINGNGLSISHQEINLDNEHIIDKVTLDYDNKRLIFIFKDGHSLNCNISDMINEIIKVNSRIDALDYYNSKTDGEYIDGVTQTKGLISATKRAFDSSLSDTSVNAPQSKVVKSYVDAETSSRQSADSTLQANINKEILRATQVETQIQANLEIEISNRKSGDTDTLTNAKSYTDTEIDKVEDSIKDINSKIPNQASSTNQLADKDFVNSSIATATQAALDSLDSKLSDTIANSIASSTEVDEALEEIFK